MYIKEIDTDILQISSYIQENEKSLIPPGCVSWSHSISQKISEVIIQFWQ